MLFRSAEGESSSGSEEAIHGDSELFHRSILISPPFSLRPPAAEVGSPCLSRPPVYFCWCCGLVVPDLGEFRRRGFVDHLFVVVHGSVVGAAVLF